MNMRNFKFNRLLLAFSFLMVLPLLFSCEKEDVFTVEFDTQAHFASSSKIIRPLFTQAGQVESGSITVTLLGEAASSDITLSVAVLESSTAISGVHYSLDSETVTIPAGEYSADVTFDILLDGFESNTDLRDLVVQISGDAAADVAEDARTATITLGYSCVSAIPEGIYVEATTGEEVTLTKTGDNTYVLSEMNFQYYSSSYADIPGTFTDVCNDLTLQGVPVPEAYDIAWIGTGVYDPTAGTLTFAMSDAEYNADAVVENVFTFKQ